MNSNSKSILVTVLTITALIGGYSFGHAASMIENIEKLLASPSGANQRYPVSAYANGVHLVVWQEGNELWSGNSRIQGMIVADDGTYGSSFVISDSQDVQECPAIATDGMNFMVVWQDLRNGSDYDIYGARIASGGIVLDSGGIAIATGLKNQAMPAIGFDGTNYVVIWMDNKVVDQSYHIRAIRVSTSGVVPDASSTAIIGVTDYETIMAKMNNNLTYVPTFSGPAIGCYQQKCIAVSTAMQYPPEEWFGAGLRAVHINTPSDANSPIVLDGAPFRLTNAGAYAPSGYSSYPATAWQQFYPSFANAGERYLLALGCHFGFPAFNHMIAAPVFDNESTGNPPVVSNKNTAAVLSVHTIAAPAMSGRTTVALRGTDFLVFWATVPGNSDSSPVREYSIVGAKIDSNNAVSTYTVITSDISYRGFPTISVGNNRGLLVYEKDAGASGIQLAGILFDKSGLPLNGTPDPSPNFDFSLSSGGNRSVQQGNLISNTITASLLSGISQPVAFSVGDLPQGLTHAFSSQACAPSCTPTITINASNAAAPGTFPITVTGTYGAVSHTTSFYVTVTSSTPLPPSAPSIPKNLRVQAIAPPTPPPTTLSIPITIQEALPAGVTGMARTSEPVTVGIPLAVDSGITSANQLGLSGSDLGQFRPLARWPNGNIKWVLVDARASVAAGGTAQITLTNSGVGNFGGSNLAADSPGTISINTGSASFTIKKPNFNVFDIVTVGGTTLVNPGNSGGVRAKNMSGTTEYSSINDSSSTATIEENGPARCVIKATGSLRDTGGNRLLDYTLRLHFYRDKSYVKAYATIRNANLNYPANQAFSSFEVVVPLTLGSGKTAQYSLLFTTTSVPLSSGDVSHLMQGYSNGSLVGVRGSNCYDWDPPLEGTCSGSTMTFDPNYGIGLEIKNNSTYINSFNNNGMTDWTQGYAGLSDSSGKGVGIALRWMSSYWPAGFEIKENGETSIELFSKYNHWKYLKLNFRRHEGREILWDFHANAKSNQNALYELQYPLIGRASLSYYQNSSGIYGQPVSSKQQQEDFFVAMNQSFQPKSPSLANPAMDGVARWYNWRDPGGWNQLDVALDDLTDYLRTGSAGFYLRGENRARFVANVAVPYSDNYFEESVGAIAPAPSPVTDWAGINGPSYATASTQIEHDHVMSMPFLYYLTGEEGMRDAFNEYGQWLELYRLPYRDPYFRQWARYYRNMALLYQFSCDTATCRTEYNNWVKTATDYMLNSQSGNQSDWGIIERNLARGYQYWGDQEVYNPIGRVIHSLFCTQIHFEAIYQVVRIWSELGQQYREQELLDYMLGLAHFYLDELLDYDPTRNPEYQRGFMVNYPIDVYKPPQPASDNNFQLYPYDASRAAVYLYQHTGDEKYLTDAGIQMLAQTLLIDAATSKSPSELQDQALIHAYYNKDNTPVWKPLAITQQSNGGGSYTISWTVPSGATRLQIKYSDRPIVEWLGFDKASRSYKYDPSQYTAFFAAQNIASIVELGQAGSVQTKTITLEAGKQWYFSAKYLSNTP